MDSIGSLRTTQSAQASAGTKSGQTRDPSGRTLRTVGETPWVGPRSGPCAQPRGAPRLWRDGARHRGPWEPCGPASTTDQPDADGEADQPRHVADGEPIHELGAMRLNRLDAEI